MSMEHAQTSIESSKMDSQGIWSLRLTDVEKAVSALKSISLLFNTTDPVLAFRDVATSTSTYVEENRARLDAVQSNLLTIHAVLARLHNRSLPIHRLPLGILGSILFPVIAASLAASPMQGPRRISFEARSALSSVCHLWYDACARLSALWTRLDFRDGPDFRRTSLHIQRAGRLPLSVSVRFTGLRPAWHNVDGFMPLLSMMTHQIEELELSGRSSQMINLVSKLKPSSLAIRKFTLSSNYDESVDEGAHRTALRTFLHGLPRLMELDLDAHLSWSDLGDMPNIIVLCLGSIKTPTNRELEAFIRSRHHALRKFTVSGELHNGEEEEEDEEEDEDDGEMNDGGNKFQCLELHTLDINAYVPHLLSIVSAPALRTLSIDDAIIREHFEHLVEFLVNSPSIEGFTIYDNQEWFDDQLESYTEEKLQILNAMPNLLKLSFHGGAVLIEVLQALGPRKDPQGGGVACACPHLVELELHDTSDLLAVGLAAMVVGRAEGGGSVSPISVLCIDGCGGPRFSTRDSDPFIFKRTEEAKEKIERLVKTLVWKWEFANVLE